MDMKASEILQEVDLSWLVRFKETAEDEARVIVEFAGREYAN